MCGRGEMKMFRTFFLSILFAVLFIGNMTIATPVSAFVGGGDGIFLDPCAEYTYIRYKKPYFGGMAMLHRIVSEDKWRNGKTLNEAIVETVGHHDIVSTGIGQMTLKVDVFAYKANGNGETCLAYTLGPGDHVWRQ